VIAVGDEPAIVIVTSTAENAGHDAGIGSRGASAFHQLALCATTAFSAPKYDASAFDSTCIGPGPSSHSADGLPSIRSTWR